MRKPSNLNLSSIQRTQNLNNLVRELCSTTKDERDSMNMTASSYYRGIVIDIRNIIELYDGINLAAATTLGDQLLYDIDHLLSVDKKMAKKAQTLLNKYNIITL